MSLFQESIIRKYLDYLDQEVVEQAYLRFKKVYSANKISNIKIANEEQYQEGFIKDIFGEVLGYSVFPDQPFNIQTEKKNEANSKKADGAIFKGENVVGVIELKDNKTKNLDAVKDQAFGYKNNHKECRYVISSNFHKLRFYVDDATDYEEFDLYNLDKDTFKRFYLYLHKEGLLDKNIPKLLRNETKFHEDNITKSLYKDYSSFKNSFFQNVVKNNPQYDKLLLFKKSQKFLDKVLFVLFAEDKGLVSTNSIVQIVEKWNNLKNDAFDTPKPLYQLIALFFSNLFIGKKDQKGGVLIPEFGGEIFAPDEVLDTLLVDDEVLQDDLLKLSKYDFNTDVDVNILGHIFEHSLSEIEEVEASLKGEVADKSKGKRKKDGVFYTPKYITKYIVENTIGTLCAEKKTELKLDRDIAIFEYQKADGKPNAKGIELFTTLNQYKDWLLTLKILDPACGSGAFLNQAVNFLVLEHTFIDDIIAELTNSPLRLFDTDIAILENNIYGVDINEESIEIAKLSLWLRTARKGRKLSNLSNNIKCGNSLIDDPAVAGDKAFNWHNEFPEVFAKGGFDVVIGNPPYGAILNLETQRYLNQKYIKGGSETAISFIKLSYDLLVNKNGRFGFIIPKSFTFSSNYAAIRDYILDDINEIIDCKKVWKEVLLEQIIFFFNKKNKSKTYNCGKLLNNTIEIIGEIDKINFKTFGFFLNDISNDELNIGLKVKASNKYLNDIALNQRGGIFQNKISGVGDTEVLGGAEIQRNGIVGIKGKINRDLIISDSKCFINDNSLLVQNLVAHIENPKDHIKITACLPQKKEFAIVDTVNQLTFFDGYSSKVFWSLLNSKLINWYCYRFIYARAIRTMHFDNSITNRIPIPTDLIQQPFIELADILLFNNKELQELSQKFLRSLERKFSLTELPKKLQDWYLLSYPEFIKELEKKKIKLSLSEEAEWEMYFTSEAQKAIELKSQIEKTDKEIDQMVYALYELTEDEIKIVEES
jgi:hypothetical protein